MIVASFTDAWIETKLFVEGHNCLGVASFTDAWIETRASIPLQMSPSRIFYRCVDWNTHLSGNCIILRSRIFYRCVDWNRHRCYPVTCFARRIFYRCVDWNNHVVTVRANSWLVASFTDAWIETESLNTRGWLPIVASFTDAWIETN